MSYNCRYLDHICTVNLKDFGAISSQVKSSQKVLLQQNNKHTWNNTETETHWVYLPHTILASVTLQWPHCGDNRVSSRDSSTTAASSCTKGYHAENLQCNQRRQHRHYYDPSAPVNNKSAKGAYMWSSPVCLSMCEGSEYTSLSVTKVHYSKCNNFKSVGLG